MPTHLSLVRSAPAILNGVSPCNTIARLTHLKPECEGVFIFLPHEGEVLRRTLKDLLYTRQQLRLIVQRLRELDRLELRVEVEVRGVSGRVAWMEAQHQTMIDEMRADALSPVFINQMLAALQCHQYDVVRELGKRCRQSLLQTALVIFITTHSLRLAG